MPRFEEVRVACPHGIFFIVDDDIAFPRKNMFQDIAARGKSFYVLIGRGKGDPVAGNGNRSRIRIFHASDQLVCEPRKFFDIDFSDAAKTLIFLHNAIICMFSSILRIDCKYFVCYDKYSKKKSNCQYF